MTAVLSVLTNNPTVIGVVVAFLAIVAALFKGRIDGAKAERNKNAKKELDAYEQSLKDLESANRAGASVHPGDGGMLTDKRNRDTRP